MMPLFKSCTPPLIEPAPFAVKLPARVKNPPLSCPLIKNAYVPLSDATEYGPLGGDGGSGVTLPPPPHAAAIAAKTAAPTVSRYLVSRRFTAHLPDSHSHWSPTASRFSRAAFPSASGPQPLRFRPARCAQKTPYRSRP